MLEKEWTGENELVWTDFFFFLIRKAEFLVFVTHWRHFMLEKDWTGENELVRTDFVLFLLIFN